MQRVMTFVQGSNLFGTFKHLDIYVDDYEILFRYLFEQAIAKWRMTCDGEPSPLAQHVRVHWCVVDGMDEWDISSPRTQQYLLERFHEEVDIKGYWLDQAERSLSGTGAEYGRIEQAAFAMCLEDFKNWYEKRQSILSGMNRFHHAVEASTDFIEIQRCGRWKVDLLRKTITERGIDVCFSVDILALQQNYDLAILIGADADGVPSLPYIKDRGKQVAVVELVKGSPAEGRSKTFASPLKVSADFIVPVYETELIKLGIAKKGSGASFSLR